MGFGGGFGGGFGAGSDSGFGSGQNQGAPADNGRGTGNSAPQTRDSQGAGNTGQPSFTQGATQGGFSVAVSRAGQQNGTDALSIARGIGDQTLVSSGRAEIAIPADAFSHTNTNAVVTLQAQQTDGKPLPTWVKFDATTGKFSVDAPADGAKEIVIKVTARDAQGKEAVATFKIKVEKPAEQTMLQRPGRAGLSEQIRLTSQRAGAFDHLVKASRTVQSAHRMKA